jgi:hypothetical protein
MVTDRPLPPGAAVLLEEAREALADRERIKLEDDAAIVRRNEALNGLLALGLSAGRIARALDYDVSESLVYNVKAQAAQRNPQTTTGNVQAINHNPQRVTDSGDNGDE